MRRTIRFAISGAGFLVFALLPLAAVLAGDGTQSSSAPPPVSVKVQPHAAETWADYATITPGRIDSPAHIADVAITAGPDHGATVPITLKGGAGHEPRGDAVLQFGSVIIRPGQTAAVALSPDGSVTGTLISANAEGDATIESGAASAKILFRWGNALSAWDSMPLIALGAGPQYQQQVIRLKLDAAPIDNHAVLVTLGDLDYTDEQGNHVTLVNQPDAPQALDQWAASPVIPTRTDQQGNAYVDMIMINAGENRCYRMYDMTAFDKP